jgi:hypothetical protein
VRVVLQLLPLLLLMVALVEILLFLLLHQTVAAVVEAQLR